MLSIIVDVGGGYLIARYINTLLLSLLAAFVVGIASAAGTNILLYVFASNVFTPEEIGVRIASGIILHPIVTVVALFIFRRKRKSVGEPNPLIQREKS
jgi:ABC-type sugar transport system permease subunit